MKKARYSGEPVADVAEITRDRTTRHTMLEVKRDVRWKLFAGPSVGSVDFTRQVAEGSRAGRFSVEVSDRYRNYFQFESESCEGVLSESLLPLEGGYNFRDLGGIATKHGRCVKWGAIIRSDDLAMLTVSDLQYLSTVPVKSVVDFRSSEEIAAQPDKIPVSVAATYDLSIAPGNLEAAIKSILTFTPEQIDSAMMDMNRLLVSDATCIARYKEFFGLLQDSATLPLLFHCSAGKDRTGMAAALFLFSLGVDRPTIFANYTASNQYTLAKYAPIVAKYPQIEGLLTVKPEYLLAGIELIEQKHRTVENFLVEVLNVDLKKMKDIYLF